MLIHIEVQSQEESNFAKRMYQYNYRSFDLYERGYDRENIRKLFRLVDWMMALPEELQQRFEERLERYEEDLQMPLLSRMELRGLERGRIEGSLQNARKSVIVVLQTRFAEVSSETIEAINGIEDISQLEYLLIQAIAINDLADFQQLLSQGKADQES